MYKLDFHADDYGISINNSKRIIQLTEAKRLDSFSIIANMGCFEECMELLRNAWPKLENKPLISIHINLIDGYKLSSSVSNDIQDNSWGRLFIKSLLPGSKRKALRAELSKEIAAQIKAVYTELSSLKNDDSSPIALRLDSHVHTHMIPVVFDAMTDALEDLNLLSEVTYIRNSAEPLCMFFTTKGVKGTFSYINVIKNIILNMLSKRVSKKCLKYNISTGILWGLILSGRMDTQRIDALLPQMESYASSKDKYLEVLCHPGIVLPSENRPEYGKDDLVAFFSPNRDIEYDMIMMHK